MICKLTNPIAALRRPVPGQHTYWISMCGQLLDLVCYGGVLGHPESQTYI